MLFAQEDDLMDAGHVTKPAKADRWFQHPGYWQGLCRWLQRRGEDGPGQKEGFRKSYGECCKKYQIAHGKFTWARVQLLTNVVTYC